jgi:hypothetical protein
MATVAFLLVLVLVGPVRCTVSAPNSTWWPCSSLSPHQNLQLEQVILLAFICNYQRILTQYYYKIDILITVVTFRAGELRHVVFWFIGTKVSYEPAASIFSVENGTSKLL